MSARLYPYAFGLFANESLDWETASVRAILLSQAFTYNPAHQFRDEISDSYVIATSGILESPTFEDGVAGGLPFEWLQIASNRLAHHIVLFDDSGDDPYSPLIAYYGAADVNGLPLTVAGEDYFLYPTSPPGGFFRLTSIGDAIGPVNTYHVAYNLALGEGTNGVGYSIPLLYIGRRLSVNEQICLLPDELDSDECCAPTIRSSICE